MFVRLFKIISLQSLALSAYTAHMFEIFMQI